MKVIEDHSQFASRSSVVEGGARQLPAAPPSSFQGFTPGPDVIAYRDVAYRPTIGQMVAVGAERQRRREQRMRHIGLPEMDRERQRELNRIAGAQLALFEDIRGRSLDEAILDDRPLVEHRYYVGGVAVCSPGRAQMFHVKQSGEWKLILLSILGAFNLALGFIFGLPYLYYEVLPKLWAALRVLV